MPGKYAGDYGYEDKYHGDKYDDYSDFTVGGFNGMSDMSYGKEGEVSYGGKKYGDSLMDFTITEEHRGRMMDKRRMMHDHHMPKEHPAMPKDHKGPKKEKKGVFRITVCHKEGHPWEHRIVGTNDCLMVNGIKGGIIHVKRGETYKFIVEQHIDSGYDNAYAQYSDGCSQHHEKRKKCDYLQHQAYAVYLTADPMGGHIGENSDACDYIPTSLPDTPLPTSKNCTFKIKVGKHCPEVFYYQTADYPCMGGVIIVYD